MNNKFSDLFVLDLANNHQSDIKHAKTIINEVSEVIKKYGVSVAIKFQFRNLATFVHKDKRGLGKNKMVDRFLTTSLTDEQFFELKRYVDSLGILTACTPFDESSVDKVVKMGFDYIKIASCSSRDWPLIEKIKETEIPLIASTGGLSLEEIDELVYFISDRRIRFALMHCVSVYPTPDDLLDLERIDILKRRYPNLTIGWSTHEDPDDYETINLAYSLGARVFEKHIGKSSEKYKLNKYSACSENIDQWLNSFVRMKKKLSSDKGIFLETQKETIKKLVRGGFVKKDIGKDKEIKKDDLYYAFPVDEDSIECLKRGRFIKARKDIKKDMALTSDNILDEVSHEGQIEEFLLKLRALLQKNNFTVTDYSHIDLSCHRGFDEFYAVGSYFIDRSKYPYIKKIVVMLPSQFHPSHKHKDRSELFTVISGDLIVKIEGRTVILKQGDQILVDKDQYHEFSTIEGVIFEEIAYSENYARSIYKDDKINNTDRSKRVIRIKGKVL